MNKTDAFLEKMLLIRRAEEKLLELFSEGKINGTTHTYIGQEACAVGVISSLNTDIDIVISNHRSHGHYLAYGGPLNLLFAEIVGHKEGVCSGIGGSQHLKYKNYYSNGILGGTVPMAIGMAFAEKMKKSDAIITVFLGDGALGEGIVYESFNIASLWQLPVLFVIEANGYAQSTHVSKNTAGSIIDRPRAFSIETYEMEKSLPQDIYRKSLELTNMIRGKKSPKCLILNTYRLGPHSKGDDYRNKGEVNAAWEEDVLNIMLKKILPENLKILEDNVERQISKALKSFYNGEQLAYAEFLGKVGL